MTSNVDDALADLLFALEDEAKITDKLPADYNHEWWATQIKQCASKFTVTQSRASLLELIVFTAACINAKDRSERKESSGA